MWIKNFALLLGLVAAAAANDGPFATGLVDNDFNNANENFNDVDFDSSAFDNSNFDDDSEFDNLINNRVSNSDENVVYYKNSESFSYTKTLTNSDGFVTRFTFKRSGNKKPYVTHSTIISIHPTIHVPTVHVPTIITAPTTIYNSKDHKFASCSAPPASVEVCLTSIFISIEKVLTSIDIKLKKYELSMESQMKYEHELLYREVSWVKLINSIAVEVKAAVSIDYTNEKKQVQELILEKKQIEYVYEVLIKQLDYLKVEISDVEKYEKLIVSEYVKINKQKWTIESAISEIVKEKEMISKEELEIRHVVEVLYSQVEKIQVKIEELYKREDWLVQWEEKLYADLVKFKEEISYFKEVEVNLKKEELLLYKEQESLYLEVEYVRKAMVKLHLEYSHIVEYLNELEIYEKKLEEIKVEVSYDKSIFIDAYTDFTCEDSILYHEACDSSHKAPANNHVIGGRYGPLPPDSHPNNSGIVMVGAPDK